MKPRTDFSPDEAAAVAPGNAGKQTDVTGHLPVELAVVFWLIRIESKPSPKTVLVERDTLAALAQMWRPEVGEFGNGDVEYMWIVRNELATQFNRSGMKILQKAMERGLSNPDAGRLS